MLKKEQYHQHRNAAQEAILDPTVVDWINLPEEQILLRFEKNELFEICQTLSVVTKSFGNENRTTLIEKIKQHYSQAP
jgi:hypothetical protein